MTKAKQIPLAFNNDRDVKRVRAAFGNASDRDLKMAQTLLDQEYTRRARPQFRHDQTKDAMAGFLDKISFDYFCTFTTRRPVSLYATRRIAEKVCDHVGAGHEWSVFWAAEEFDVRDGFHFHALMKQPVENLPGTKGELVAKGGKLWTVWEGEPARSNDYAKMDLFNWYFQKYGRCQLIDNREPDRQLAASHYISKYITKKITDYDFRIAKPHML